MQATAQLGLLEPGHRPSNGLPARNKPQARQADVRTRVLDTDGIASRPHLAADIATRQRMPKPVVRRSESPLAPDQVTRHILLLRGERVMLDRDLATLYDVPTKVLNQAVRRHRARFPDDFMFQLTDEEATHLRSQSVTSRSGHGGRRYAPYAFTEQGVAMLSSVLHSPRAIAVNIEIMRAFVRLRQLLATHADLARKLAELERTYDAKFRVVFDAIRQLMEPPPDDPRPAIGFR